jgi:hypothetical protein
MQVSSVTTGLFQALDEATHGKLHEVWDHCKSKDYELHLSVISYLDGLPGDQMKLYVQAFKDGESKLFAQANLEGEARVLGWNLYLYDKLASARGNIRKAKEKIGRTSEAQAVFEGV